MSAAERQLEDKRFEISQDSETKWFYLTQIKDGAPIDDDLGFDTIYFEKDLNVLVWDLARDTKDFVPVLKFDKGVEEEQKAEFYRLYGPALKTVRGLDSNI